MKTNIKMRVTPEQSVKVQEICFDNNIGWGFEGKYKDIKHLEQSLLFIYDKNITFAYYDNTYFINNENLEIDADLFIRTNGTCEENELKNFIQSQNENIDRVNDWTKQFNDVSLKLKKKNEILKKARIKRKNQREELQKLNRKLQKCISLEEHRKVINWHIERNQSLFAEIEQLLSI